MREYIVQEWQHTSVLELIAVIFAIVQVLLAYKNNVLTYPAGIISTAIFTWIFGLKVGLYADASLNLYYFIMSVYGWIVWSRKRAGSEETHIAFSTKREIAVAIGIVLIAFGLLFLILKNYTDSQVPFGDAVVSAFAWSGMWLMARRKIENWIFLNISNAIAVPLLFYKHLPLTALLTVFLFIVAVFGYLRWRKIIRKGDDGRGLLRAT